MLFLKYCIARAISKIRIPAIRNCEISNSAFIDTGCVINNCSIGRYSYLNENCNVTKARIGSFSSIGSNCQIGGGIHSLVYVSTSPVFCKKSNCFNKSFSSSKLDGQDAGSVKIGNDVWIGTNCYIKAGVTIGDGAIIGAHAVVTHDVQPYSIMAGVPARLIRYRFEADTIMTLLDMKWWEWSEDKLNKYGQFFDSPESLIQAVRTTSLEEK